MNTRDEHFIKEAITLARKGLGQTSPNPAVGAVIVHNDQVVGTGYHMKAGTPHAERHAIRDAEERGFQHWSESTLYCTLEPCSTVGTTGACSTAIIEKKIGRVVYGSVDPNPSHRGKVDEIFAQAGVNAVSQVCEADCDALIRGFRKVQATGLPWIIVKSAMSLDGKITRPSGEGQWLTNPASRNKVHEIRSTVDAIITGGNTLRKDNPTLTVRLPGFQKLRQPKRVIFTRGECLLPADLTLIKDPDTLIFKTKNGLRSALKTLAKTHAVNTVLIEAGGELLGRFFDENLVDEVAIFYAPLITGGDRLGFSGEGINSLPSSLNLYQAQFKKIDNDIMLSALVKKDEP